MKKWKRDFFLGSVLLIIVLAILAYSYFMDSPRVTLFLARPDTYMAMWLIILGILSVLLMLRAYRMRDSAEGSAYGTPIWNSVGIATVVILAVYLMMLKKLGFIIASTLMLWALLTIFSLYHKQAPELDKRALIKTVALNGILSVTFCVALYFLFTELLSTKLPKMNLF